MADSINEPFFRTEDEEDRSCPDSDAFKPGLISFAQSRKRPAPPESNEPLFHAGKQEERSKNSVLENVGATANKSSEQHLVNKGDSDKKLMAAINAIPKLKSFIERIIEHYKTHSDELIDLTTKIDAEFLQFLENKDTTFYKNVDICLHETFTSGFARPLTGFTESTVQLHVEINDPDSASNEPPSQQVFKVAVKKSTKDIQFLTVNAIDKIKEYIKNKSMNFEEIKEEVSRRKTSLNYDVPELVRLLAYSDSSPEKIVAVSGNELVRQKALLNTRYNNHMVAYHRNYLRELTGILLRPHMYHCICGRKSVINFVNV